MKDVADRTLRIAVRMLPDRRRNWGRAMLAELAALDEARERRRFAVSCLRATITGRATADLALVGVAAVWAASFADGIGSVGVRTEAIVFVGVLAAVSWAGRRGELRARSRLGSGVRLGAFGAVAGCQLLLLGRSGGGASRDPAGFWVAELTMVLVVAGTVALTARRGGVSARALRRTAAVVAAGAGSWLTMLLAFSGIRLFPLAALLIVAGVVLTVAVRERTLVAAFGAGAAVSILIFLASVGLYWIFPDLVPVAADDGRHAENSRIESTDPYVPDLLLGGVFGALTVVTAALARQTRSTTKPEVAVP